MWLKRFLKGACVAFLSFFLVILIGGSIAVAGAGIWAAGLDSEINEDLLALAGGDRTTRLYCQNSEGGWDEISEDRISGFENSLFCPIEEMSPELIQAFISIEDKRFYEHGGIDWARTAHAVLSYLRGGEAHFGGSTITQQLVKNLTGDNEKSVRRKVSELLRAVKLEKMLTKQEILEKYLNIVNLSESCYGVRVAANAFFSKEPSELTLSQSATIAAITNNPGKYNPIRHPTANQTRRDIILREMYAQGHIDAMELERATGGSVELSVNREVLSGRVNSFYADLVVSDVIADLMREKNMSRQEASRLVYCGGLQIYTAMSAECQRVVSDFYRDPAHFPTHEGGKKAQSGLLLVDPSSGDILAVCGAVGEKSSNRIQSFATDAKRPSGSVIKPLSVYAPALAKGLITAASVFDDIPLTFKENGAPWPRNSPNIYRGLTTVNTALAESVNTVCISVLQKLGAKNSYRFLCDELGFTSLQAEADMGAAALALGQQHLGVTLREVVSGYTALAGDGIYRGTRSYYKVLDNRSNVLLENRGSEKRVLTREDAAILTMMLRDAVRVGTGKALTLKEILDVAGKTGTTGKNCDKWFVGYTPELLCGVWYGYEYPAPLNDVKGNPALQIFDKVMHGILEVKPMQKKQFSTPEGIVAVRYCRDSGLLPCSACLIDPRGERTVIGYFKRGTEPKITCDRHVTVSYCDHGGVASADCDSAHCYPVSLVRVERSFPRQINVLDAPYTYVSDPLLIGRNLNYNEPYYAIIYDTRRNYGVEKDTTPFNRSCPMHVEDPFWERRDLIA